jgi:tRNA(fMet)-specific endonuclease VapC
MIVVDTSVWVYYIRDQISEADLPRLSGGVANSLRDIILPVVVRAELLSIAKDRRWSGMRSERLETLIRESVSISELLPFVGSYVEIENHDRSRTLGKNDLWIAACAAYLGLPLLTFDRDFAHLSSFFPILLIGTDQLRP